MKKIFSVLLAALIILAVVGVGAVLFRHFVTNQIMDRGGMENPDAGAESTEFTDEWTIF